MQEILEASMRHYTLPFTALLILAMIFWLLMIFGGGDIEMFDIDVDPSIDLDVDGETLVDGDVHTMGILKPIAQALHLGQIPIMIPLTVVILLTWLASIYGDQYFNPEHKKAIGFSLLVPYMVVSLFCSWLMGLPFRKFFKLLNHNPEDMQKIIGSICEVNFFDKKTGSAMIFTNNAPMHILIYSDSDHSFQKGDKVEVKSLNNELNRYLIEPQI